MSTATGTAKPLVTLNGVEIHYQWFDYRKGQIDWQGPSGEYHTTYVDDPRLFCAISEATHLDFVMRGKDDPPQPNGSIRRVKT